MIDDHHWYELEAGGYLCVECGIEDHPKALKLGPGANGLVEHIRDWADRGPEV